MQNKISLHLCDFFAVKKIFSIYFLTFFFAAIILHAQNGNNQDRLFSLAHSYETAGQFEKAEEIYSNLFAQQNTNYEYFEALNLILIKQKKYNESILLLDDKIKQTPQDINIYGLLGSTYFMMDSTQKAFDSWERGIRLNPANAVAYRVITNYVIENRAFDKAIEILKRGKENTDDPAVFSLDLANIYAANMRFEDAANEYCNLLQSHPEQAGLIKTRIASYLPRQGAEEPTIKTLKKFIEDYPTPQALDLLIFIYTSTNRFEDAFPLAIEYNKKTTDTGDYIFIFAQQAFQNKNYDVASKAYSYVVENFPSSNLLPLAKIGYANTLAENIEIKNSINNEAWKPFVQNKIVNEKEYHSVIEAYSQLAKEFPNNAIYPQAIFKIAKIYSDHLFDFKKADSLYTIINNNHALSNYSQMSFIERGKIAVITGNTEDAKNFFKNSLISGNISPDEIAEAKFYLAKIEFWNGNFTKSLSIFRDVTKDLSADFTNDALELSSLIGFAKRDSLNLYNYAQADLYSFQNKFKEAANAFKTLADNPNLFILNEFANLKFSEMLIAQNEFSSAIKTLKVLAEDEKTSIFADKSFFLLAQTYQYGILDFEKAAEIYQKLLEKFPNSLYLDRARDCLKDL